MYFGLFGLVLGLSGFKHGFCWIKIIIIGEVESQMHENQSNQFLNESEKVQSNEFGTDTQPEAQKIQHLDMLKRNNQIMCLKIKEINGMMDQEVRNLKNPKPEKRKRKNLFEQKDPELQQLYLKCQQLKKKTKEAKFQKQYKDHFEERTTMLKSELTALIKELSAKQDKRQALRRKLKKEDPKKREFQEFDLHDSFKPEIQQLQTQISKERERISKDQFQFIKKNRSNSQANRSILEKETSKTIALPEMEEDRQIASLKGNYETMGKRIELLKIRKGTLIKPIKIDEKKALLSQLKTRYQELTKLVAK